MLYNIRSGGNEVGVLNGIRMSEQRSEMSLRVCCITATCDIMDNTASKELLKHV
jgi:hypothetical protein